MTSQHPEPGQSDAARERVVVRRGQCFCPRCDGRLTGFGDVTTHPTIHVRRGGRIVAGALIDSKTTMAFGMHWVVKLNGAYSPSCGALTEELRRV